MDFLKRWTLPIAMLAGVAGYFIYGAIPALNPTHAAVSFAIGHVIQPTLLFLMLFVAFCRISPKQVKFHRWHAYMLCIQGGLFIALALIPICWPAVAGRAIIESAMICLICPTATAASVVTLKLGGNASQVVSYTCLINLLAALLVPAILPLLHESGQDLGFLDSFALIMGKVFPLLILPLITAWIVRFLFPKVRDVILRLPNLAFYLWSVALSLAIAVSTKEFMHSNEPVSTLFGIAAVSLVACVIQFGIGRWLGHIHGEDIAGAQSMGQKNTIFAIWMGYTFLNPVTSLAGGFYSVWHNVVNSCQLYRKSKENTPHKVHE